MVQCGACGEFSVEQPVFTKSDGTRLDVVERVCKNPDCRQRWQYPNYPPAKWLGQSTVEPGVVPQVEGAPVDVNGDVIDLSEWQRTDSFVANEIQLYRWDGSGRPYRRKSNFVEEPPEPVAHPVKGKGAGE